jgi:hypothetical protein
MRAPLPVEIIGSGSICARARQLIADGADPAVPVIWTRGGVQVFVQSHPLGWWAAREVDGRNRLVLRTAAGSADLPNPQASAARGGSSTPPPRRDAAPAAGNEGGRGAALSFSGEGRR